MLMTLGSRKMLESSMIIQIFHCRHRLSLRSGESLRARSVDTKALKSSIQPLSLTVDGSNTILGSKSSGGNEKKGAPFLIVSANNSIKCIPSSFSGIKKTSFVLLNCRIFLRASLGSWSPAAANVLERSAKLSSAFLCSLASQTSFMTLPMLLLACVRNVTIGEGPM